MKKRNNKKYKLPFKRKILIIVCGAYILLFLSFSFLFYGPIDSFKEFWITSAMTTMDHRYLATWIYSDSYIQKVLEKNSIIEVNEDSDLIKLSFENIHLLYIKMSMIKKSLHMIRMLYIKL